MTKQIIDFDWDKYQSGEYDVYTKMGQKVSQLTKFNVDFLHEYVGVVNGEIELWFADGIWHTENATSSMDLVLRSKEEENCNTISLEIGHCVLDAENVGDVVIPKLKGILMEVSDEEDFENTSQELIIGTLNGLFISNTLESWEYARPIKEIKEAWVNVYENNSGEVVVSQYSFNTRQEAILNNTYLNFKYIKTIKITNKKDGETN